MSFEHFMTGGCEFSTFYNWGTWGLKRFITGERETFFRLFAGDDGGGAGGRGGARRDGGRRAARGVRRAGAPPTREL